MAVQPGLCQTWSETPKTSFLTRLLWYFVGAHAEILSYAEYFICQGDREGFETYYRRQRRKQARLSLQPPSNMVCISVFLVAMQFRLLIFCTLMIVYLSVLRKIILILNIKCSRVIVCSLMAA